MSERTPVTLTQPDDHAEIVLATGHRLYVYGDGYLAYALPDEDPAAMHPLTLAPGLTGELFDWDAGVWHHTGTRLATLTPVPARRVHLHAVPTPVCGARGDLNGEAVYAATCTLPHGHTGAHEGLDPVTHDGGMVTWHGDHTDVTS